MTTGADITPALARGERSAVARALNLLETAQGSEARTRLIDAVAAAPRPGARVVGLTGPPGVGKSTLAGRLIAAWRERGLTVGVIAVDPSSQRSGGALLGDRARMARDADDDGVFIRSMAARARLGGLAPATWDATLVMRAAFDRVLVETVGVGQSETDVVHVADLTVVVVQPGSGDTLQFIKAGLMEVFDILVVNKADLGELARTARRDLKAALRVLGRRETPIVLTSATSGDGVAPLVDRVEAELTAREGRLDAIRGDKAREHALQRFGELYGQLALARIGGAREARAALARLGDRAAPSAYFSALEQLANADAL